MSKTVCRLYLISPSSMGIDTFKDDLSAALDAGDIAAFQLRLKGATDNRIRRASEVLLPICKARKVPFIINDRPDLASELGCDGVHIGQKDASYAEARNLMGEDAIIGVTCHNSTHLALTAAEQGADYVAFGAFFETGTKETAFRAPLEILSRWQELMEVPCVAIGGITAHNCAALVQAGADFLAVVGAVWNHTDGPKRSVEAINKMIKSATS